MPDLNELLAQVDDSFDDLISLHRDLVRIPSVNTGVMPTGNETEAADYASQWLAQDGIEAEVIDVRSLVPLDTQTILGSVVKTGRLYTVEENPRLCGWGAEIASIAADECFYDLDGPVVRITTPHIPLPAADNLEDIVLPTPERIVEKIKRSMN